MVTEGGAWDTRVEELLGFLSEHDRFPSRTAQNLGERNLSQWLTDIRQQHREGKLSNEQVAFLDENFPAWAGAPETDTTTNTDTDTDTDADGGDVWLARAEEIRDFITESGSRPAADGGESERSLGLWLRVQQMKHAKGELSAERVETLNRFVPGWNNTKKQ